VPARDTTRISVVLRKPRNMSPAVHAVTKLSKLNQFSGGVSDPVLLYSSRVLNEANSSTTRGSRTTTEASTSEAYLAVRAT
jgi:hypothetical protein